MKAAALAELEQHLMDNRAVRRVVLASRDPLHSALDESAHKVAAQIRETLDGDSEALAWGRALHLAGEHLAGLVAHANLTGKDVPAALLCNLLAWVAMDLIEAAP